MKKHLLLTTVAFCLASAACTTTGDPTTGGIFWSPAKAQARQQSLMNESAALHSELSAENAKTQDLIAQRERLRSQIAAKKAALQRATSPAQAATLSSEISALEQQLARL